MPLHRALTSSISLSLAFIASTASVRAASPIDMLIKAYPEHLERIEGNDLIWRDGTRMPLEDGAGPKSFAQWLENPDIADMLEQSYPAGGEAVPPPKDKDPGRARNARFFDKMYGNCHNGEVATSLTEIVWLPKKSGQKLKVTHINGVDRKLAAISLELDALPSTFDNFIVPSAGAFNCRVIAGTDRTSAHGYGIAIDISVKQSDYWRWHKPNADGTYSYRNRVPLEIVRIFESHGFIWGGRWHHFDTMHFEYRPELLDAKQP